MEKEYCEQTRSRFSLIGHKIYLLCQYQVTVPDPLVLIKHLDIIINVTLTKMWNFLFNKTH